MMRCWRPFAGWSLAALLAAALTAAQEPAPPADQQKVWSEEALRLAAAEAQTYDIRLGTADGLRLELADKPALRWSNTEDATIHGSVVVWMYKGRPEAVASIFKFFTMKDEFSVELHSLAEGPLVAIKDGHIVWQPAAAGVNFTPLGELAPPAKSAPARLTQMRAIARDFTGTMTTFDETTHPLRLMTQPLVRYAGDKQQPVDGTIFAYARATDPDVLLLLEARADDTGAQKWNYALARMHCGALAMSYRDRQVWSREQMSHPFERPKGEYTLFQDLPEPPLTP
jgi:hypothetical protein